MNKTVHMEKRRTYISAVIMHIRRAYESCVSLMVISRNNECKGGRGGGRDGRGGSCRAPIHNNGVLAFKWQGVVIVRVTGREWLPCRSPCTYEYCLDVWQGGAFIGEVQAYTSEYCQTPGYNQGKGIRNLTSHERGEEESLALPPL